MKRFLGFVIVVMSFFGFAQAQTYIQLILDLSGSMYEKLESGEPKIDAARVVLTDFISELPDDNLNVGLRVYGATTGAMDAGACEDSQLSVAMQGVDKDALLGIVSTTKPKGATPIAYSLQQAVTDFQGLPVEAEKIIVLVTDGEESCGGDLQAALAAFESQGIKVDLRIVGLGLSAEAAKTFEGIGGTFENALDTTGFATALQSAVTIESPVSTPTNNQLSFPFEISGTTTAEGLEANYTFSGNENTPILFHIQNGDYMMAEIQVLDVLGETLAKSNSVNRNDPTLLPFTPEKDGEYTVKIIIEGEENYKFTASYIAGAPSQRVMPLDTIVPDTVKEGVLGAGASARCRSL
jgi:hypothetical protein